ncbi:MAG TPA: cysteine hydrolase family protein [Thermoleophilaceae bacterium]|nr:cysteine hydrolase family protein [Thermoleophilaceae bacterium]
MDRAALIVVDVQRAFDDPVWGPRDNPDCEANVARLLAAWRKRGWPVVFVRHDSEEEGSPLAPDHPGNAFKDEITGEPDLLVTKQVNSAFYGDPDLHAWLSAHNLSDIVVCGITTNHCCETTARMAGNLGYEVWFCLDATCTFDRAGPDGVVIPAADLSRATAASLHGEFATVVDTDELLAR